MLIFCGKKVVAAPLPVLANDERTEYVAVRDGSSIHVLP